MQFIKRLKGTRITRADVIYLLLRVLVVIVNWPFAPLGWLIALTIFIALDRFIIWKYGLIPINTTDKNVWYDQQSNRCNIMSALILDKCDEAHLRKIFQKKVTEDWVRFRSRMVKVLDSYYLKELKSDELKKHVDDAFTVLPPMKSLEEVSVFMNE